VDAAELARSAQNGPPFYYRPIRFAPANKVDKSDKLLLAFDALVLRITVDWDTSQADDFRTRGVPWTIKRTSLERGRVTRSDRESLT
jgi:hypothetical protein